MKWFVLCVLYVLMFVPSVQAGYTIFTRDQITPASITVYGVDGPETRNNPGTPPVYPGTFQRRICAARDLYSPLAADRAEVWVDSAGNIPTDDAALFAACPQIRDTKRAEIRAEGDRRLGALATPYMLHERETWATQKEEATAWTANNAAPIPMVSNMAAARGITVAELMAKIMENVNLFTTSSGAILGEQQFLLDWIDREQSFDTLLTIGWPQ